MLYTAYLLMCMIGPLGSGGCALATAPLQFQDLDLCMRHIHSEVKRYERGEGLEALKPHLPTMGSGKLRVKGRCSVDVIDEWLKEEGSEVPRKNGKDYPV